MTGEPPRGPSKQPGGSEEAAHAVAGGSVLYKGLGFPLKGSIRF